MDVVSTGPLRVASMIWQPRPSSWTLTFVCKATFRIEPGVCALADRQEEPGADDLVPFKKRADVLLVGHAYAPPDQPARAVLARLAVGEIDKRIEVWCDRVFWQDGRLLEGQPFSRMGLSYERAAAGPGNPVGVRFDAPPDSYGSVRIPNLQPAGTRVTRRGDTFAPIAFGPIPPGSRGPTDHNVAPDDQQLAAIQADEPFLLEGLHPQYPRLETRLPGIRPKATLKTGALAGDDLPMEADTLRIDTDLGIVTVTWRGRLALTHAKEPGQIAISLEAPLPPSAGDDVEGPTLALGTNVKAVTLPFAPRQSLWASSPAPQARIELKPPPEDTGTVMGVKLPAAQVLPFARSQPPVAARYIAPLPPRTIEPIAMEPPPPAPEVEVEVEVEPEPITPRGPGLPTGDYPLGRCAAIAASIARRRADTAKILEENQLDAATWEALKKHHQSAIAEEMSRGKTGLLREYDAAYVGRLEEERGPIQLEEYARLMVATERGTLAEALAELGLPRSAMVRIDRVWMTKTAALGPRLMQAIEAAREA